MKKSKITSLAFFLAIVIVLISYWPIFSLGGTAGLLLFSMGTTIAFIFLFIGSIGAFFELKMQDNTSGLKGYPLAPLLGIVYIAMIILTIIILPPLLIEISQITNREIILLVLVEFLWGFSIIPALVGVIIYDEVDNT